VAFFLAYRPLRELTEARLTMVRAAEAFGELHETIKEGEECGAEDEAPIRDGALESPIWALAPLELRGLALTRGSCRPFSLQVEAGSIVAIAGPTGIGKTTLLRTLLGLEAAVSGQVVYGGVSLDGAPAGPAARPFAWVPQDAPLLFDTLAGNVSLGALEADAADAMRALGASHLAKALDDSRLGPGGRAVSGGERQWIALARAIATRQPVLLLDEPTAGLDPEAQRVVLEAIARLRGKRTVLLVTHQREPLAVADVVLRVGRSGELERAA